MPPHGRRASSTVPPPCPALAGTVTSGQSPIPSGKAPNPSCTPPPLASTEAEPPSGGHRRPPGGSEILRKILTMPPQMRRACSTVPQPCPVAVGTGARGQSPIPSGNAPTSSCTQPPLASREAEPPSGGPRRPPREGLQRVLVEQSTPAAGTCAWPHRHKHFARSMPFLVTGLQIRLQNDQVADLDFHKGEN
jgi:hypothetical protein